MTIATSNTQMMTTTRRSMRASKATRPENAARRRLHQAGVRSQPRVQRLRSLLHVLDGRERDAFGALLCVAEIELVLGHEHGVAIDVVGDPGTVGGDEGLELLPVVGGHPARQLKLA